MLITIAGDLSLKINFENLSLIGHEETYVSLEKFSFETKVLKTIVKLYRFTVNENVVFIFLSDFSILKNH